ncbi:transferrin-like [Sitodiplosis mosellana]|uniref:transferrin-like n=1 Tax=Sitodiplosis mosellana TaxID=263140 RepID=UPI002444E9EC|nr:transferrin-like [Sitodiplosis mosellana]
MKQLQLPVLLLISCQLFWVAAQLKIKHVCVTSGFEEQCNRLARETQEIRCVRVQDSIECAKHLRNDASGFGIFSAESTLLLAALNYDGLTVLKELRHRDRLNYTSDFESVVVVKATHKGGIEGLKGKNYCHPGLYYDRSERWSERFLKHFERSVIAPDCNDPLKSPAEIELEALAKHFGSGCRPGAWSNNPEEDQRLKAKYPQFCDLCTSTASPCEYTDKNRHIEALRCLLNKGEVAYVSLQDAQDFFSPLSEYSHLKTEYAYLCPDDTLQLISDNSKPPCAWLRQPWPVIISNAGDSIPLKEGINRWIYGLNGWESAIKDIITADNLTPVITTIQRPRDIFFPYREVPYSLPLCSTTANWCTKSIEEKEKCDVLHTAGVTTGIFPLIECNEPVAGGAISCLEEVNEGRADFTGIDSSLGYIARHPYNLTTALYGESDKQASAVVVVHTNSNFKQFEDLRKAKACIAEFDGIASVSFLNIAKNLGLFKKDQCNHIKMLSNFFGSSCVPGAMDPAHGVGQTKVNLCSLCPDAGSGATSAVRPSTETQTTPNFIPLDQGVDSTTSSLQNELAVLNDDTKLNCNADRTNSFYGDQGALFCLHTKGDVAILGLKDLKDHARALAINPNDYQIICRNGSLAERTGFDVDTDCALQSFVDSEIVVKPKNPKTEGIINALLSYDKYLKVDPDFKIYNTFDGHKDLLFNNGTVELVSYDEKDLGATIDSYKNLFNMLDACGNAFKSIPTGHVILATVFFTVLISRLLQ